MDDSFNTNDIVAYHQQSLTEGPLPPAAEFEHYEQVLPGTANRILSMAEKEAEHRHKLEIKAADANVKIEIRGQYFAFITILLALAAVVACVALKQPFAAITPIIVALAGLTSVFLNKKK